ncbi:MAG: CoA-transferase [Chloroflexi bacterium]|nr:CoA-transferase [Chloroflexota bacterium]
MADVAHVSDLMVIAIARLLRDGETVLHGVASVVPMVAVNVAKRLHAPNLVYLSVAGAVDPRLPALPSSSTDQRLMTGSASVFANEDFYDFCSRGQLDTAFLGAVQMDAEGRTNVSVIGEFERPKVRLPGGGGAAVIMPTAKRVIVWRTQHNRRVFVEKIDFVTGVGNVDRVVTPLAVLRRQEGRLRIESVHAHSSVEEIVENTGFDLGIVEPVPVTPEPTAAELAALAAVDPGRVRDLEFH